MDEPITSADHFAEALSDVATRYMAHLEPSAERQDYDVHMTITGQTLNIAFHKRPGMRPFIQFTLQSDSPTPLQDEPSGGFFGRR